MDDADSAARALPRGWHQQLASRVGADYVRCTDRELEWAGWDASGTYRLGSLATEAAPPIAVVLPGNTDEVVAVVRWAYNHRVPLVPRGAGTGVMGGAIPQRPAVVVDLSRLRHIHLEANSLLVEAGAGATLGEVNAALRPHNLILGHDPWSVGLATVGGAIGTNGVGYMAGRWGGMADQVAALTAVLADGSIVSTPRYKPSSGPDLRGIFVGAQGTMGFVTSAWLYATPYPESQYFRCYRFPGFEVGYRAIIQLWRTGLRYDLLDFGDGVPGWFDLSHGHEDPQGRTAVLYLAAFGQDEEAKARMAVAHELLSAGDGHDLGGEPAQQYWNDRHSVAERYAKEAHQQRNSCSRRIFGRAGHDYLNIALPPARLLDYRRKAMARIATDPD